MKTFEIEFERKSYITLSVEANSQDEAEAKAWQEVASNYPNINDASWEIASIEETK